MKFTVIRDFARRHTTGIPSRSADIQTLFDEGWYLSQYPDVRAEKMDASFHYLRYGANEGRDPHPLFSTSYYKARYPQVARSGMNPLIHFIKLGAKEGYSPHPIFSSLHVTPQLPKGVNPLLGYIDVIRKGANISPHPLFDCEYYLSQLPSGISNYIDPLSHYLYFGANLGLDPHPMFSTDYYRAQNADIGAATNPLAHYLAGGHQEGRNPHPAFETGWYRSRYMQNLPASENPLLHFLTVGIKTGASPHILFPTKEYQKSVSAEGGMDPTVHPLLHALETGQLKFQVPKLIVDDDTTLAYRRKDVESLDGIHAFVTFNVDAISGGIFSIFSIVSEFRSLGENAVLYSLPGGKPIVRYKRFNNDEIILPFGDLITALKLKRVKCIHAPEVILPTLQQILVSSEDQLDLSEVCLNILNQNGELMPERKSFSALSSMFGNVSMTTAHERYSTQLHADRWEVPIKHISTYMSYDDYCIKDFTKKRNLIILSPDRMIDDEVVLDMLQSSFGGYHIYRVTALHYEFYKFSIAWAKFCITFGEGLDNYFIETVFTGGIPFAVYNPAFMPSSMRALPNVFSSLVEMKSRLAEIIRDLEIDDDYRKEVFEKNYDLLSALYDKKIYRNKLRGYLDNRFDVLPERSQ